MSHVTIAWIALSTYGVLTILLAASSSVLRGQEQGEDEEKPKSIPAAPDRAEGDGPFGRLILRGATLVDGTGAPADS